MVARHLGMRVDHVTLTPPRGYDGWCWVTAQNLSTRPRPLLALTLAGPWAEGRFLRLRGDVLPLGSDSDLAATVRLAHEIYGTRWRSGLNAAFLDVATLLDLPEVAGQVAAVARALLTQPVLRGAEAGRTSCACCSHGLMARGARLHGVGHFDHCDPSDVGVRDDYAIHTLRHGYSVGGNANRPL